MFIMSVQAAPPSKIAMFLDRAVKAKFSNENRNFLHVLCAVSSGIYRHVVD
jgi:hypothetical protein